MTWNNRCLLLALTLSTVSTLAFAQAGDQESTAPGYPSTPTTQYPYQQPAPIQRTTGGQQYQQQYQQPYPQQNQQTAPTQAAGNAQQSTNPDYQNHFFSHVTAGQVIAPAHGTASAVPATGVFLRVAQGASVRLDDLNDTELKLEVTRGVANVAIHNSVKNAELLVDLPGGETAMVKDGFYTFNASTDTMRVLKGEAYAYPSDHMSRKPIKIKEKHAIYYNGPQSKVFEFDPSEVVGDLVPFGPPQGASMGGGGFDDGYGNQAYGTGVPYDWYLNEEPYWWSYPYWWDPGWDWGFGLGWGWGWRGWGGWGGYGWGRWGYGGWGRYGGWGDRGGWGGHPGGVAGGGFHGGGGGGHAGGGR